MDVRMPQRACRADEGIITDGQAVWSCPPDAGVKPCETIVARRRWLTSPVHRGEHGAAVKTIARGMPVVPAALSLLACAKCTIFCTQGSRVRPASGIPCALRFSEGHRFVIARTQIAPRGRGDMFDIQFRC